MDCWFLDENTSLDRHRNISCVKLYKTAFETVKKNLEDVALTSIDKDQRFVLETDDSSTVATSATLYEMGNH